MTDDILDYALQLATKPMTNNSNNNWLRKLKIECIEEQEDGSLTIQIEWDETDPDFEYWVSLGKEGQKTFFLDLLTNAITSHGH